MKLSNGREIKVDLSKITIKEWRFMWAFDSDNDESDKILGGCVGMTVEEIQDLLRDDFRRLIKFVVEASKNPLDDENLAEASTSD